MVLHPSQNTNYNYNTTINNRFKSIRNVINTFFKDFKGQKTNIRGIYHDFEVRR